MELKPRLPLQSTKLNLVENAPALVATFGSVGQASPLQAAGVELNIHKVVPKSWLWRWQGEL